MFTAWPTEILFLGIYNGIIAPDYYVSSHQVGGDSDLRSVRVSPGLCQEEDDDDRWRGGEGFYFNHIL